MIDHATRDAVVAELQDIAATLPIGSYSRDLILERASQIARGDRALVGTPPIVHTDQCASVTTILTTNPPRRAACDCGADQREPHAVVFTPAGVSPDADAIVDAIRQAAEHIGTAISMGVAK